jgi:hypothetical protein
MPVTVSREKASKIIVVSRFAAWHAASNQVTVARDVPDATTKTKVKILRN